MNNGSPRISRRTLLSATAGVVGSVTLGSATLAQARQVEFDRREQIDAEGTDRQNRVSLRVAWKEWYNGEVVEQRADVSNTTEDEHSILVLDEVMPGDSGRVVFGLSTEATNGNPPPMEVAMRIRMPPDSQHENGVSEPEEKAGDSSADVGELQDFLDVDVWYDTGIKAGGVPLYGTCDGAFNTGDSTLETGALSDVAVTSESGSWWTIAGASSDGPGNQSCLRADGTRCVTLEWGLASNGPDINLVQGDTVGFVVEFRARQCRQ